MILAEWKRRYGVQERKEKALNLIDQKAHAASYGM